MADFTPRDDLPELDAVLTALFGAWCAKTCQKKQLYMENNPAWGQCTSTAIMLRRLYGGVIMQTTVALPKDWRGPKEVLGGWRVRHYYNVTAQGNEVDATRSQFPRMSQFNVGAIDEPRVRGLAFGEDALKRAILLERLVFVELGIEWIQPIKQHPKSGKVQNPDESIGPGARTGSDRGELV